MATNGDTPVEDTEMVDGEGDQIVTMMDVLKEQQDFEDDANAVLGASDEKECTYAQGYIKRQAIYACMTCCPESKDDLSKRAGFCLACSLACHENHELIELYTKRNFRCDCGNPKFKTQCQFTPIKLELNEENVYNQNFIGLYCNCNQPYDPDAVDDEMIQCIVCEDWWHASHLDAAVPANDQYSEMICKICMTKNEFLHDYTDLAVNVESGDVDVVKINGTDEESSTLGYDKLSNGTTDDKQQTKGDKASDKLTNGSDKTEDNPEDINAMDTSTIESKNDVASTKTYNELNKTNGGDSKEAKKPESTTETEKNEDPLVSEKLEKGENIAPMDTNDAVAAEANNVTKPESTSPEDVTVPSEDSIATKDKSENSNEPSVNEDNTSPDKTNVEESNVQKAIEDDTAVSEDKENVTEESSENVEQTVDQDESQQPVTTQNDEGSKDDSDALEEDSIEAVGTSAKETSADNVTKEQEKVDDTNNLAEAESNKNDETETAVESPNAETTDITKTEETSQDIRMDDTSKETEEESANTVISKDLENSPNEMMDDTSKETEEESANTVISKDVENNPNETMDDTSKDKEEESENTLISKVVENSPNEINSKAEAKVTEESDDTNGNKETAQEVPNLSNTENKRKLSTEEDIDVSVKKPKLDGKCSRPKGVRKVCKGATFWPSHFRQKLCTCSECLAMYKDLSVLFLTDIEDTVFAYETLGKERTAGKPNQYEKGMAALSSLGRIQQIDALTEYNKMRDKLLTYLQSFKDRKEIVTEQDIKTFFAGMKPEKRMDGVYFCK